MTTVKKNNSVHFIAGKIFCVFFDMKNTCICYFYYFYVASFTVYRKTSTDMNKFI